MSLLKSLISGFQNATQPVRDIENIGVEGVKAINRSTPWGQANAAQQPQTIQRPAAVMPQLPTQGRGGVYNGLLPNKGKITQIGVNGAPYYQRSANSTVYAVPYSNNYLPKPLARLPLIGE